MFMVVGVDAVCGQDYRPISLVCVNGLRANTSVGINPSQDDRIRFEAGKYFVQSGSVKRAVPFLNYDNIRGIDRQLWKNLAARCSFDCDTNSFGSHLRKRVPQIGFELLSHPDHGM